MQTEARKMRSAPSRIKGKGGKHKNRGIHKQNNQAEVAIFYPAFPLLFHQNIAPSPVS